MIEKIIEPFNSPLETGVRSVIILATGYPSSMDLERLLDLDYLVVHSGDVGGPESLHPALPLRTGELIVRRELIERGLLLMMSRGLVKRLITEGGFEYQADDTASPFIDALSAPYLVELKKRTTWAISKYLEISDNDLRVITNKFFQEWTIQFQAKETGHGES